MSHIEKMLKWLRSQLQMYNVEVRNLHDDFRNGIVFCALIHSFDPTLFKIEDLNPDEEEKNLELAFSKAESLGIKKILDVEDILEDDRPDSKIVFTYLTCFVQYYKDNKELIFLNSMNYKKRKVIIKKLQNTFTVFRNKNKLPSK